MDKLPNYQMPVKIQPVPGESAKVWSVCGYPVMLENVCQSVTAALPTVRIQCSGRMGFLHPPYLCGWRNLFRIKLRVNYIFYTMLHLHLGCNMAEMPHHPNPTLPDSIQGFFSPTATVTFEISTVVWGFTRMATSFRQTLI